MEVEQKVEVFEFAISGVLLSILCFLGLMGNVFCLIVFSRPNMKSSVNCCLQSLSIFDSGVLITAFLFIVLRALSSYRDGWTYYSGTVYPYLTPVLYPLALMAQTGSIWCTVAVTMERYIAVCLPLKARSLCTFRKTRLFICFVVMFSIIYNIPRFFETDRVRIINPETNDTVFVIRQSSLRKNKIYFEVYHVWLYLSLMYFVPFLLLTSFNVAIWRTVNRSNNDRQSLTVHQKHEINLAVMLFCVVAVFFVCNLLAPVVNLMEYFGFQVTKLVQISNLLVVTNSAVNFIIYCSFGRKFRTVFGNVFSNKSNQKAIRKAATITLTTKWTEGNGRALSCSSFISTTLASATSDTGQDTTCL